MFLSVALLKAIASLNLCSVLPPPVAAVAASIPVGPVDIMPVIPVAPVVPLMPVLAVIPTEDETGILMQGIVVVSGRGVLSEGGGDDCSSAPGSTDVFMQHAE